MAIKKKEVRRKISIDFGISWFHLVNENEGLFQTTIRTTLQGLFPRYPHRSTAPGLLKVLLKDISKSFFRQKNTIGFWDIARSATNPSILQPVFYKIQPHDPYNIIVDGLRPTETGGCYHLSLTVVFDRELDSTTLNRFSHERESVKVNYIIDEDCNFLEKAKPIAEKTTGFASACTLL